MITDYCWDGDFYGYADYDADDDWDDWPLNQDLGEPDDVVLEDFVLGISHYTTRAYPASYVYVMNAPLSNLVKIGKSNDPESRRSTIQHTSGLQIDLLRVWGCASSSKALTIERRLHEHFARYRSEYGEWFKPEGRLRAWLIRLCGYDPESEYA